MKVTFKKTGRRHYRVSVEGPGIEPSVMDPAPGYDNRLPHDAAHFIVENELEIKGGIFGQLASGGSANTFRNEKAKNARKTKRRGKELARENRADALFSEHAVYAAQSRWNNDEIIPDTKIPPSDIARICCSFEEFAAEWSKRQIGGSVTREWRHGRAKRGKR